MRANLVYMNVMLSPSQSVITSIITIIFSFPIIKKAEESLASFLILNGQFVKKSMLG